MTETAEIEKTEGPSLAELIETRRFLGREFLAWLWFESEVFEGKFKASDSRDKKFGDCEISLGSSITLETVDPGVSQQRNVLTGVDPCSTPEAYEALRQGKLPTKAAIAVFRGDQSFKFTFDADSFGMSSLKLPALLRGEGDDPFFERISLIEEIEGLFDGLFQTFLHLRLGRSWGSNIVPAMRDWMRGEVGPALTSYRELWGR